LRESEDGGQDYRDPEPQKISEGAIMPGNIFYIIGVVVVVLFILGYLGLR
jgi:hypothetical protein